MTYERLQESPGDVCAVAEAVAFRATGDETTRVVDAATVVGVGGTGIGGAGVGGTGVSDRWRSAAAGGRQSELAVSRRYITARNVVESARFGARAAD